MSPSYSSYTSSPTATLPPNPPDQYFMNDHDAPRLVGDAIPSSNAPDGLSLSNSLTPTGSFPSTPGSLAGRKRSRSDAHSTDDEAEPLEDGSVNAPLIEDPPKPRGQPIYGPGMILIYPDDPGYSLAAESQSGTWVEEKLDAMPFQMLHTKRPSITSRKSQRVDSAASGAPDLAQLVLPPGTREVAMEPLVDEATRALGISWTRMDATEALRINQAAYSKWIQHHFPILRDVTIWFENSALPGYLVAARNTYTDQQEYYLFSHDLTEARLVTNDQSQLIPRLMMLPALHLAAPGGCIRAKTLLLAASQNHVSGVHMTGVTEEGPGPELDSAASAEPRAELAMEID